MNDNLEIQREAIIEIVGTQYEGRAINHQTLFLHQDLILKHQKDNPHDHNAVLLLTDNGKELGFLPKGYASLYSPAIDSGRYSFTVEVLKSEIDPERPILIVKITSELKNHSDGEIEADILGFVQNIVNGYANITTEYLTFISSETVNVDDLLSTLNKSRLIYKLYHCSSGIIESCDIKQNSNKYTPQTAESFTRNLSALKVDVSDVLKKIQKAYNESLDIDDEDEYYQVQSEIRERRKKFRSYDEFLTKLLDCLTSYADVSIKNVSTIPEVYSSEPKKNTVAKIIKITDETMPIVSENDQTVTTQPEHETKPTDCSQLTEQAFFDWLVSEGGVSYSTAKQYIFNIHSIEKLYQSVFGVRKNILGANSSDNVKSILETLVQKSEYIDANDRRHNSFSSSLNKFAHFAGISIDGIKALSERKTYQPPLRSGTYVIKTVDFDTPQNCTYYKPCAYILNNVRHSVGSWFELYKEFLILLYNDKNYSGILKSLNGKSLYGHRIDFADEILFYRLRKPIRVSNNFFAEGNLSAVDIINRIKRLMVLCSINNENMIIEYSTHDRDNTPILPDNEDKNNTEDIQQFSIEPAPLQNNTSIELKEQSSIIEDTNVPVTFYPDTAKPFVLKDALIEILLTDAPETTKYHEFKGGISSKNLRALIKEYYGKNIGLFEISKLLMLDKTFKSVGRGCYTLNEAMRLHEVAEPEQIEHKKPETFESANAETETVHINHTLVTPEVQFTDIQDNENVVKDLTINSIKEVIKENSDNLQYEDGFGAYEVKTLLSHKGIKNASEEQIEALMSECSELQEIEDGYYILLDGDSEDDTSVEQITVMEEKTKIVELQTTETVPQKIQEITTDARHIFLKLNGDIIRAYDYSDALNKVCEFSINCKPFKMARIAEQAVQLHGKNVFYRRVSPVDGYNKLSNDLQIIKIETLSDLQMITAAVQKYCRIDDDMITIISN